MVSNTENVSGAQTNAERSRPSALPEALEAFVCTFQKLWIPEVVDHKAESIRLRGYARSRRNHVIVDFCKSS